MEREMDRRIGAASAVMRALYRSVVVKRELSRKAMLSIYRSIYVPTLTYGHELTPPSSPLLTPPPLLTSRPQVDLLHDEVVLEVGVPSEVEADPGAQLAVLERLDLRGGEERKKYKYKNKFKTMNNSACVRPRRARPFC